jgi:translation initiation factor eIF-2B subunit epsilon
MAGGKQSGGKGQQKGGAGGAPHGGDSLEARAVLQAVLLADSFNQRFRPMSLELPKALTPLVGVPMIEYALEWLAANRVQEVGAGKGCAGQLARNACCSAWL